MLSSTSAASAAMTRRRFLEVAGTTGLSVSALGLMACGRGAGTQTEADGSKTIKVIHAAKAPLVLWAVSYLAEDQGLYAKAGLNVQRVLLDGGPAGLSGLLSGAGSAVLSSPGEMLSAVAKGQKLKALMAYGNTNPAIFVVSDRAARRAGVTGESPLAERRAALGRIRGGRYGITTPGSQTDGLTRLALKQAGVEDGAAKVVPLQSGPNCLAALARGQIDGFVAQSPAAEQAVVQVPAVPLLFNSAGDIEGGDRLQGQTLEAKAADVEANEDLFRALVGADVAALKVLVEDPDAARDRLRRTRFADVDDQLWPDVWAHVRQSWGSPTVTADGLRAWVQNGLVGADLDESSVPYDEVVDMRFVDDALRDLSWTPPAPRAAAA